MDNFKPVKPSDVMTNLIDGKKMVACILKSDKGVSRSVKDLNKLTVGEIIKLTECKNVAFFMEVEKE